MQNNPLKNTLEREREKERERERERERPTCGCPPSACVHHAAGVHLICSLGIALLFTRHQVWLKHRKKGHLVLVIFGLKQSQLIWLKLGLIVLIFGFRSSSNLVSCRLRFQSCFIFGGKSYSFLGQVIFIDLVIFTPPIR